MTNVFERARAIRMSGEPWQNAVQRAGSQIRYENQVGGAKLKKDGTPRKRRSDVGKKRGSPTKKLPGQNCVYNKKSGRCRLSAAGKRTPQHTAWKQAHQAQWQRFTRAEVNAAAGRGDPTAVAIQANRQRFASYAKDKQARSPGTPQGRYIAERYDANPKVQEARRAKAARDAAKRSQGGGAKLKKDGTPRKTRKDKGGKHASPVRKSSGLECVYNKKSGRCRLSAHGKRSPQHQAYVRAARARPVSRAQQQARDAFEAAASGNKGRGTTPERRRKVGALKGAKYQNGGWDGYSNTSSTRSSDFTSVSDSTSYSQNGGSWTSNDSSSLW